MRQNTWHFVALGMLVACGGGSSGNGGNADHSMDATGGADAMTMSHGSGGSASSGSGGTASSGSGGMHSSTGASGGGGHATAGDGASGAGGKHADGSSATGGKPSNEHDAGSKPNCPPECLRAYTCARSCNEPAVNNGCCPCPDGMIDTITCNTSGSGSCGLPCTGAKPDDAVAMTCQAFTDQAACTAWHGNGFPDHCEWHTP